MWTSLVKFIFYTTENFQYVFSSSDSKKAYERTPNLSAFFMVLSAFTTSPIYSQTKVPCGIGSAALIAQPYKN
jgi:hypothetical protein